MELLDILDKDGRPTGLTVDRDSSFELNGGQYYLGVHVYIYSSAGEFLLQQRSYGKGFLPGGWDIHMGHVIAGETSKDGAVREIREEIGLSVPVDDLRFVKRIIWERYHHMIDIYFLKTGFNADELILDRDEVIGAKTISKAEMLELVSNMHYRPEEYRQAVADELISIAEANDL